MKTLGEIMFVLHSSRRFQNAALIAIAACAAVIAILPLLLGRLEFAGLLAQVGAAFRLIFTVLAIALLWALAMWLQHVYQREKRRMFR